MKTTNPHITRYADSRSVLRLADNILYGRLPVKGEVERFVEEMLNQVRGVVLNTSSSNTELKERSEALEEFVHNFNKLMK